MYSTGLLQLAIPLVKSHGFTREALSLSAMSLSQTHSDPLPDTAVTALFGQGDAARRTLITAWLKQGRHEMVKTDLRSTLHSRLRWNESALQYLPEAFALLASPGSGIPPLGPMPAFWHASSIADQACHNSGDTSAGTSWYARRASLAAVYTVAELHQLKSPKTAYDFLDSMLAGSRSLESNIDEVRVFTQHIGRSWAGIIRSSSIF